MPAPRVDDSLIGSPFAPLIGPLILIAFATALLAATPIPQPVPGEPPLAQQVQTLGDLARARDLLNAGVALGVSGLLFLVLAATHARLVPKPDPLLAGLAILAVGFGAAAALQETAASPSAAFQHPAAALETGCAITAQRLVWRTPDIDHDTLREMRAAHASACPDAALERALEIAGASDAHPLRRSDDP